MPPPTLSQFTLNRRPPSPDEPPGIEGFGDPEQDEKFEAEEAERDQRNRRWAYHNEMENKEDAHRRRGDHAGANRIREQAREQAEREADPEFGLFGTALIAHRARVRQGYRDEARQTREEEQRRYDEELERRSSKRNRPPVNDWTVKYTSMISPKMVNSIGDSHHWREVKAKDEIVEYLSRYVAVVFTDGKPSYFVRKSGGEQGFRSMWNQYTSRNSLLVSLSCCLCT